jgi:hypothetical protein
MKSSQKNRVRLSIETLEHRDAAAALTISPPGYVDPDRLPIVQEITASANPGGDCRGPQRRVVRWSLGGAPGRSVASAAAHSHDRPFHLEESGPRSSTRTAPSAPALRPGHSPGRVHAPRHFEDRRG